MDRKAVRVHCLALAAHRTEVESALALLDEVLHGSSFAVEPDTHLGRHIHVCDEKGVHQDHLPGGLLHFAQDPAGTIPAARPIPEFPIADGIRDGIFLHGFHQITVEVRCFLKQDRVLLQADDIGYTVRLTLGIKVRCGKPAVSAKKKRDIRAVLLKLIKERPKEWNDSCTGISGPAPKLHFQKVARHSIIADQRMIAVRLIVTVEAFPFLMTIGVQESGIQVKEKKLRLMDAVNGPPHTAMDGSELVQRVIVIAMDES